MSRIFDALQRSGTEQSGVEYPDMISMATAVFESPRSEEAANVAETVVEEPEPASLPPQDLDAVAELQTKENANRVPEFPSLAVSVAPSSRLVFLYATGEPGGREIPLSGCSPPPDATEPAT